MPRLNAQSFYQKYTRYGFLCGKLLKYCSSNWIKHFHGCEVDFSLAAIDCDCLFSTPFRNLLNWWFDVAGVLIMPIQTVLYSFWDSEFSERVEIYMPIVIWGN